MNSQKSILTYMRNFFGLASLALLLIFGIWFVSDLIRFGVADVQQSLPQILSSSFIASLFLFGVLDLILTYIKNRSFTLSQLLNVIAWGSFIVFFLTMHLANRLNPPLDIADKLYLMRGIDLTIDKADEENVIWLCQKRAEISQRYRDGYLLPNQKCQ